MNTKVLFIAGVSALVGLLAGGGAVQLVNAATTSVDRSFIAGQTAMEIAFQTGNRPQEGHLDETILAYKLTAADLHLSPEVALAFKNERGLVTYDLRD